MKSRFKSLLVVVVLLVATAAFAGEAITANTDAAPSTSNAAVAADAGQVHKSVTAHAAVQKVATPATNAIPARVAPEAVNITVVPTFSASGIGLLALALVAVGFFVLRQH